MPELLSSRRVQGKSGPMLTPYESQLADALAPKTPPKPDELKAAVLALYAKFALFDGKIRQKAGLHLHLEGVLAGLAARARCGSPRRAFFRASSIPRGAAGGGVRAAAFLSPPPPLGRGVWILSHRACCQGAAALTAALAA